MIARLYWTIAARYWMAQLSAIHRRNPAHPDARVAYLRYIAAFDKCAEAWDAEDAMADLMMFGWILTFLLLIGVIPS